MRKSNGEIKQMKKEALENRELLYENKKQIEVLIKLLEERKINLNYGNTIK